MGAGEGFDFGAQIDDSQVAAVIATGGAPADIDADAGILGVIDHVAGTSHLSLFTYNRFGELMPEVAPVTIDCDRCRARERDAHSSTHH